MTRLSIVTVVYNAEATIGDTMDSVAAQNVDQIEHIVIDGLSTDRTLQIVQSKRRPFTRVISERDEGIFDAFNKGVLAATGDVVGFLHADDIYPHNEVLSQVQRFFRTYDVDCCYGDHEYVSSENVGRVVRYWKAGRYHRGIFRRGWMPPHPTLYVRRETYRRLGLYNTDLRIASDYELMLRFLHKHGVSVGYIPDVLTRMRVGGNSNRSLKNILRKTSEDVLSWKLNGLSGGIPAVILKNLTKLPQFVRRNRRMATDRTPVICVAGPPRQSSRKAA